jgi:hypothetical protein
MNFEEKLAQLRAAVSSRAKAPSGDDQGQKLPRVIFVLSSERSGSTLTRIMLAGHPELYSPRELGLLWVDKPRIGITLPNGNPWVFGGVVNVLRDRLGLDYHEAVEYMERIPSAKEAYREIQRLISPRTLVDKSANVSIEQTTLARAEEIFDDPFYIHLVRHPGGVINSFGERGLDSVLLRLPEVEATTPPENAELVWRLSNENIVGHLSSVPTDRQHLIRYEELVNDPRAQLGSLCEKLKLQFDEEMLNVYGEGRMSLGGGDPRFRAWDTITTERTDAWRDKVDVSTLSAKTLALAEKLGITI